MMKKATYLICLFAITLSFIGCQSGIRPTPEMTRMGLGTGPGDGDTGNQGDGTTNTGNVSGFGFENGENLEGRDTSIGNLSNADSYEVVYFDYDRSYIRESERSKLNETAKFLLRNTSQQIVVEGHCDWKGTTDYNLALGDRRANSVKSYLVQLGVGPSKIEVLSKGDLDAVEGADDAGRQLDRRANIILIP
jgi:peptidoglycan-associated lipoprotein